MLHDDFLEQLSQISQLFWGHLNNFIFDGLFWDGVEDIDQKEYFVFEKLELIYIFFWGIEDL